jgi:hypothetical protein
MGNAYKNVVGNPEGKRLLGSNVEGGKGFFKKSITGIKFISPPKQQKIVVYFFILFLLI